MTLWGETAQDKGPLLEAQDCPVITVTACRVSDYNGEPLFGFHHGSCVFSHVHPKSYAHMFAHVKGHGASISDLPRVGMACRQVVSMPHTSYEHGMVLKLT